MPRIDFSASPLKTRSRSRLFCIAEKQGEGGQSSAVFLPGMAFFSSIKKLLHVGLGKFFGYEEGQEIILFENSLLSPPAAKMQKRFSVITGKRREETN